MPTTNAPMLCGEFHAHALPPSSSPRISRLIDTVSSAPPAQSMRCVVRSTVSCRNRIRSQAAAMHSGMLTKKIHRQLTNSENRPPSVGPTTDEIAQTLAMYPCALARSATV